MWSRGLRCGRVPSVRALRSSRTFNGQATESHTTYFQQPPPQKPSGGVLRAILLGTGCIGLGAYAHANFGIEVLEDEGPEMADALVPAIYAALAKRVPPMDLAGAQELLQQTRANYSTTPTLVSHTSSLASNLPCEDTWSSGSFTYFNDETKDWCEWAIFDGHAGPRTSELLKSHLPVGIAKALEAANCFERPYTPNDTHIIDTIKKAFITLDDQMVSQARELLGGGVVDRANIIAAAATVHSGSCALLALYDPKTRILRVANTGDSRAVLGRWDKEAGKYVAQPMSVDQTGFNPDEVLRLKQDHPGEEVVDPKTGRVHGIAVSRAFGDARWKWPQEVSRRAYEMFWGPTPRSDSMIVTPPYLTAEPVVMETRIETGAHPSFLIMASDGLWDCMSNEDAVSCVQLWLDKNKPTNFLEKAKDEGLLALVHGLGRTVVKANETDVPAPTFSSMAEEDDTYFDEKEKCLRWRVSPKHFVNEDKHCAIHLIHNALGGSRRDLFCSVMTLQPPLSRRVRDDITVHVIFFGQDTKDLLNN
ncbi:hypothetical protein LTR08_007591 [Meristemomyces frigidus]|nr:hypothetical protein LTR08_007591 [Meristemomyces frigidus]